MDFSLPAAPCHGPNGCGGERPRDAIATTFGAKRRRDRKAEQSWPRLERAQASQYLALADKLDGTGRFEYQERRGATRGPRQSVPSAFSAIERRLLADSMIMPALAAIAIASGSVQSWSIIQATHHQLCLQESFLCFQVARGTASAEITLGAGLWAPFLRDLGYCTIVKMGREARVAEIQF